MTMKFIRLHPNDHELFNCDLKNMGTLLKKAESMNFEKFLIMYAAQGKTFWLRFVMTFRFYYYRHNFLSEIDLYPDTCAFYIVRSIENVFIRIHQKFLEEARDPLKLLKDILNYHKFIETLNEQEILKNNSILRNEENLMVIREMTGSCFTCFDRNVYVKCLFSARCFMRFYLSVYNLLQKFEPAETFHEGGLSNKQYWQPFKIWNSNKFMPSFFDKYVTICWGKKLPKMLSTPNITKILDSSGLLHFCTLFVNDSLNEVRHFEDFYVRHSPCRNHDNCWERITHNEDCKEPFFRHSCNDCPISCDTACLQKRNRVAKGDFWKKFYCKRFLSNVQNCNDAETQTESYYDHIETYALVTSVEERSPTPPWCLPAEVKNAMYQFKRKEDAKIRLRQKLRKKQKSNIKIISREDLSNIYETAQREFADEVMLMRDFAPTKNYTSLIESIPVVKLCVESVPIAKVSFDSSKGTRSIGSGYEGILYSTVVQTSGHGSCTSEDKQGLRCSQFVPSYIAEGSDDFLSKKFNKGDQLSNGDVSSTKIPGKKTGVPTTKLKKGKNAADSKKYSTNESEMHKSAGENHEAQTKTNIANSASNNQPMKPEKTSKNKKGSKSSASQSNVSLAFAVAGESRAESKLGENLVDTFLSLISSGSKSHSGDIWEDDDEDPKAEELKLPTKLNTCACCGKMETTRKTFKKCAQCKKENFEPHRYYCSKECQAEDWKERHREEHRMKLKA